MWLFRNIEHARFCEIYILSTYTGPRENCTQGSHMTLDDCISKWNFEMKFSSVKGALHCGNACSASPISKSADDSARSDRPSDIQRGTWNRGRNHSALDLTITKTSNSYSCNAASVHSGQLEDSTSLYSCMHARAYCLVSGARIGARSRESNWGLVYPHAPAPKATCGIRTKR